MKSFWGSSFDSNTFEEDLSYFSDTGQSFDFECRFEEDFFELLPNDKVNSLEFDLWVENEVFKLLERFECDLPSTDKVYSFGFEFSTPASSMVIVLEIFWGSSFDLNTFEEDLSHVLEVFWGSSFDSNTFEEDLSHYIDTGQSFDFDCWVEAYFFELLPSDKIHIWFRFLSWKRLF